MSKNERPSDVSDRVSADYQTHNLYDDADLEAQREVFLAMDEGSDEDADDDGVGPGPHVGSPGPGAVLSRPVNVRQLEPPGADGAGRDRTAWCGPRQRRST
jgi:hypothetical protein